MFQDALAPAWTVWNGSALRFAVGWSSVHEDQGHMGVSTPNPEGSQAMSHASTDAIWVRMGVHQNSITAAVLQGDANDPDAFVSQARYKLFGGSSDVWGVTEAFAACTSLQVPATSCSEPWITRGSTAGIGHRETGEGTAGEPSFSICGRLRPNPRS